MKRLYSTIITSLVIGSAAFAQETYESACIATEDINGTARYVGMGGAMDALGADISTISSNPAGLGLYRSGWFGTSLGIVTQAEQNGLNNTDKTVMSFDQIGFVSSEKISDKSYLNYGFNYHKSRNFNQILPAVGKLNGSSITKFGYLNYFHGNRRSQVQDVLENSILLDDYGTPYYNDADYFEFRRDNKGYIGEYDFNISGNHRDRIYWGITVGVKDVNYRNKTEYLEDLLADGKDCGRIKLTDQKDIDGTGYDIKAGIIIRPNEYSPFRIGLSVATPTWYTLETSNFLQLDNATNNGKGLVYGVSNYSDISERHKYRIDTPWKFGLSLGHTIGNYLALGLGYEYADYSTIDNRVITDSHYDDGYYHSESEQDKFMNDNTEMSLKAVHTLKAGAEFKVSPELAIRAGYNYVSPMYDKDGYRNFNVMSLCDGVYYASTTDYTNWKDTHRITFGVGYVIDQLTLDLAYQLSTQKGDLYPFPGSHENITWSDGYKETVDNWISPTEVKNERHQLLLTIGYKF